MESLPFSKMIGSAGPIMGCWVQGDERPYTRWSKGGLLLVVCCGYDVDVMQ
jgi:hypothetical protein